MTDIVEVDGGGQVAITGTASAVTGPTTTSGVVVDGPDGTTIEIEEGGEVVTTGGGSTVIATGTTAIQIVEAGGGGGGGVSDHGALTGLTDDDHPQYFLVDGTRQVEGPLEVAGTTIGWFDFSNQPRSWGGNDYYSAAINASTVLPLRMSDGSSWLTAQAFALTANDSVTHAEITDWDITSGVDLYLYLVDASALVPGARMTVISNLDWPTIDVGYWSLFSLAGLLVVDYSELAWTWNVDHYEDVSTVPVCAPGSTAWPDPPYVDGVVAPMFAVDPEGPSIDLVAADITVRGPVTFTASHVDVDNEVRAAQYTQVGTHASALQNVRIGYELLVDPAAGFYPPIFEQPTEPAVNGLAVWHDTALDEWWLVIQFGGAGNRKVQLT